MQHLSFKVHRYAPELTAAFFMGKKLDINIDYSAQNPPSRKTLVRAVRDNKMFKKSIDGLVRHASIKKVYAEPEHQWLNNMQGGTFSKMDTVINVIDKMYEAESVLIDGSTLPEPKIMVRFGRKGKWRDMKAMARKRYTSGKSPKSKIKPLFS